MTEILNLSIKNAVELMKSKALSPLDLHKAFFERAKQQAHLNAFTVLTEEYAKTQAIESEKRYLDGINKPLDGIAVGVKDLFCTKGIESTACSNLLKGFVPEYESTVTQKLFDAGTFMIGKTNMDEFAMGSANITSARGNVINPWKAKGSDAHLVPGGSSGGSSAAVAAKMCIASLGSDTGGSIRQPASFTGIVGVKPTYGRCSRFGMISFASSLDQAGCFARTVEDSAIVLNAICGWDPKDSTSVKQDVPNFSAQLTSPIKGKKIGIPKEYIVDGMPDEIKQLWERGASWLKEQGAEIVEISLPHTEYALPTYYIIAPAEASSNLARYDGVRYGNRAKCSNLNELYVNSRTDGFGKEVKRRILIGTYVLSAGYYDAYFTKAQKVRRRILDDFTSAFTQVDAILTPTAPSEAFEIGANINDPIKMYLNDVFTVPASLAGLPCISIPAALSKNELPLGLQIITNHFQEVLMFNIASALERSANFKHL
jgi:aspartyl-tRNA(Asn)/glutamyl-tRNA(Gln) amidotransferase subunit A